MSLSVENIIIIFITLEMYQKICQNIIRPLREQYRVARLGANQVSVKSKVSGRILQIQRQDDIIQNNYNQKLHLSFFRIKNLLKAPPCVIYLHANNGSRSEGMPYVKSLLQQQMSVLLFDCAGSGLSDGEYITLGVRESEDLAKMIEYVTTKKGVTDIALWGRSMGAVASIIYCSRNKKSIVACIYDSPFSTLKKLIKQLARQKTGIPEFFFEIFMKGINSELIKKANFSLEDLDLIKRLQTIKTPGIFITSDTDILVDSSHVQQLFDMYPAEKHLFRIGSQHHQSRPGDVVQKCISFLKNKFSEKNVVSTPISHSPMMNPNTSSINNSANSVNKLNLISKTNLLDNRNPLNTKTLTHISITANNNANSTNNINSSLQSKTTLVNSIKNDPNIIKSITRNNQQEEKIQLRTDWSVPKKSKELSAITEEKDSILCFLREGCWEGVDDGKILKPTDDERQATKGINNWKTMIQKNQKQAQQKKNNKTPASKISLKRILDEPSIQTLESKSELQSQLPMRESQKQTYFQSQFSSPQQTQRTILQKQKPKFAMQMINSVDNRNLSERQHIIPFGR